MEESTGEVTSLTGWEGIVLKMKGSLERTALFYFHNDFAMGIGGKAGNLRQLL